MISCDLPAVVKVLVSILVLMVVHSNGEYDYFGGRVVILNARLLEWSQAALECEEQNGTLLTVVDISTLYDVGLDGRWMVWVGLNLGEDITSMTWSSGLPVTWTNWIRPPRAPESAGQCLSVETSAPFDWKAVNCSTKLASLCEVRRENPCHFSVWKRSSIIGFANSYLVDIDLESCKKACMNTTTFHCRSLEYNDLRNLCQLSKDNRWTQQRQFTYPDPEWDYYHLDCFTSKVDQTMSLPTMDPLPPTTEPTREETTEKVCISHEDLIPPANASKHIEMVIQELQDLQTRYKNRRRSMLKESVVDHRPSAVGLGGVAIVVMAVVFGIVVTMDVLTLAQHACRKAKKKKQKKLNQLADEHLKQVGQSILAKRKLAIAVRHLVVDYNKTTNVNGTSSSHENQDIEPVDSSQVVLVDDQQSLHSSASRTNSNNEALQFECAVSENFAHEHDVEDSTPRINSVINHEGVEYDTNHSNSKHGRCEDMIFPFPRTNTEDGGMAMTMTGRRCPSRPHRSYSEPTGSFIHSTNGRLDNYPSTWHHTTTMAGSSYKMLPFMGGWKSMKQHDVDLSHNNQVMETSFRKVEND